MHNSGWDLNLPISWCYIALHQAERLRNTFAEFRAVMFPNNDADLSDLQEARGRRFVFWGDAHFMILATRHLIQALEAVQALQAVPMGPKLPKALGRQTNLLRNQLEHWEDAPNKGAWKDLVDRHGAYASPYQVMFDGVNSDLKIGADKISVNELEQRLTAVLDELLRLESEF